MSSWIRGSKGKAFAKPVARPTFFSDLSDCTDIASMYMNVLGTYIFAQRMGEPAILLETTGLIENTLKFNPQLRIVDKALDNSSLIHRNSIKDMTDAMVFSDVKKYATNIFQYTPAFNSSIMGILEKASIKSIFDIGVHLSCDSSGTQLAFYVDALKVFQKRTKKSALSVYVKASSYDLVQQFQSLCDPSWKLTTLSKTPAANFLEYSLRQLAEVQIFAVLNAAVLDFNHPVDRFTYVMHRNPKGYEYFKELNNKPWTIY